MNDLLYNWEPAVAKAWLYAAAGLMWSGVGIFLDKLAYGWLASLKWTRYLPFALAGFALALAIYAFGFSRLANKNIRRIDSINREKVCFFAFQQWHSYPLVAFMIALGIFLRHSALPKPYLAIVYIGLGSSLFLSSFHYYKRMMVLSRLTLPDARIMTRNR